MTVTAVAVMLTCHGRCFGLEASRLAPDQVFTQASSADRSTASFAVGATWLWAWQRSYGFGDVTGYSETVVGRWVARETIRSRSFRATQIGVTPVVRVRPLFAAGRLFIDLGIGANLITPLYRTEARRFSTAFNFGDHLAVGTELGSQMQYAVALRIEHFSNAGLKRPNPGVNFIQLRVTSRLSLAP